MTYRSLKYLIAFSLPVLVALSLTGSGWMTFLPLLETFLLIPLLELFIKPDVSNPSETEEKLLKSSIIFDVWIYIATVSQLAMLVVFLYSMQQEGLKWYEYIGRISAMGLMCGIYGINVAHELGHRPEKFHQWLAKALLLSTLYMHFFIEHNRGHHRWVATPLDPATSRKDEPLYLFWIRSIVGSYLSAWRLEFDRLAKQGLHKLTLNNAMIWMSLVQGLLLCGIYFFFGGGTLLYFLAASVMGILLLETVNYIEHYGLTRKKVSETAYERVMPKHSWNSDHLVGRLFLFELSRHSDHHYLASRKYQILRHMEDSPQMPTGYPGMILLSLVPPLWFYVMNRRLVHQNEIDTH